jgi:hypothetical protein
MSRHFDKQRKPFAFYLLPKIKRNMKKFLLTLLCICLLTQLRAQKFELSAGVNSGLFHFTGNAVAATTSIYEDATASGQNETNDPYGNRNGYSYGGYVQIENINPGGFIIGLQAGYDILRSKVDINNVSPPPYLNASPSGDYFANPDIPATGQTFLQSQFINFSPFLGYRLNLKKIKIDFMPGMDFGFNINSYDKGKATATSYGTVFRTDLKLSAPSNDARLKMGVAAIYKRFGLTASYAWGLNNYSPKLIYYPSTVPDDSNGYHATAYSRLLRFGISYRIL